MDVTTDVTRLLSEKSVSNYVFKYVWKKYSFACKFSYRKLLVCSFLNI